MTEEMTCRIPSEQIWETLSINMNNGRVDYKPLTESRIHESILMVSKQVSK